MASLNKESLDSAFSDGRLNGDVENSPTKQIETFNLLISLVRQNPHISTDQLVELMNLHRNTVLTYASWLVRKGLLTVSYQGRGGCCRYLISEEKL